MTAVAISRFAMLVGELSRSKRQAEYGNYWNNPFCLELQTLGTKRYFAMELLPLFHQSRYNRHVFNETLTGRIMEDAPFRQRIIIKCFRFIGNAPEFRESLEVDQQQG